MSVDIKQSPYFGTYDESKKQYRILARPGRPIQAREWNDLQEQIQNQIEKVGTHLFQNGSQVLPGTNDAVIYRNNIGFIKIPSGSNANTEAALKNLWLGKTIVSTSAPLGVKAKVIGYKVADTLSEARLFVDYLEADSTSGEATAFIPGQDIETVETVPSTSTIAGDTTSVGLSSGVFVKSSVYFFNGNFLLVDEQSIFLEPINPTIQADWTNKPSAKAGFSVIESVLTFEDDESLGDNANPSDNFGAPGADRLVIECILAQVDYNQQNDGSFIEILRVLDGVVQSRVSRTAYNVIEDNAARQKFEESGHFSYKDFPVTVKPFLKENDNGGVHPRAEYQFETQAEAENVGLLLFGISGASLDPEVTDKWLPASSYDEFLRLARGKLTLQVDPGKAYVKGYEIEKLAPSFVDFDKARTLRFQNNRTVSTNLGPYVFVTNLFGPPEIELYETIEIHRTKIVTPGVSPGARIGTAKVLAIEYFSGTHGDPSAVYKLFLFDTIADSGLDFAQMKSAVSTSGFSFSCDFVLEYFQFDGSVTPDTGNDITGFGTSFVNKSTQVLNPGDFLRVGHDDSQVYEVLSVANDTSVTLTTTPTFTGNQTAELAFSQFQGLQDPRGLVYSLPEQFAYTIRSANADDSINDAVIDTDFSIRRAFQAISNGSGEIQIMVTLANEEFEDFSPNDYNVINTDTGDWLRLTAGNTYNGGLTTAGVEIVSTTQVKIHADPADAGNNYYIIASVRKTEGVASKEKTKTLVRGQFVLGSYTGPSSVSTLGRSDLNEVTLAQADILKVTRIVMAPDFSTTPSTLETLPAGHSDVSDRFELDNGQRDYYYGIGSVFLKPGKQRPTGAIRIEFDYFTHSSQGSYFSVDSYPFKGPGANMDYAEIPQFNDSSARTFQLRDSIDFRPRLNTSGGFANYLEAPRSNVRCDFHHYLNRIDVLYLDQFGVFKTTTGTPDIDPYEPLAPGDAMALYAFDIQAYTATPDQCFKRKKDNSRSTMADIGRLRDRVANLEATVLLTLADQGAKDLAVKDAFGLDRIKNGYLADNFKDHSLGNLQDPDYRASIDQQNEELRPQIHQDHAQIIETATLLVNPILVEQARETNNYQKTGTLFTLPYDPVKFIDQDLASQVENVNPYAKFTFKGRIALDPSTDTWRDTVTLPVLEVVDDTAYKAAQAGVNPNTVIWGEWETNWSKKEVGKPKVTEKTKSLGPNKPDSQHSHNWPRYVEVTTTQTVTKTIGQIRKGLTETVVDKGLKTQSLGTRVVSIISADYIRTRDVTITAQGFMPNAVLYPFFDSQSVAGSCNPESLGFGFPIRADFRGSVNVLFRIPTATFLTGERIFKLTTSPTNSKNPQPASDGEAKYFATGWVDSVQETELSIRQFEVQTTELTDTRIQVDPKTTTTTKTVREDPIAQSFTILEKGGCNLLAVDIFFFSKDPNVPVKLQLRTLSDDGFPTNNILFGGEVIKDAADVVINEVDLTTGKLTVTGNGSIPGYTVGPWDGSTSNPIEIQRVAAKSGRVIPNGAAIDLIDTTNDMIPTRFIFKNPLFTKENNDYAVVLLADSVEYLVWVCQAGPITPRPGGTPTFGDTNNTIIGTTTPILKDNFINGVFYRSSNGVTWNPDQLIDMKFALHKAQFVTNDTGVIEYVNEELPNQKLQVDPIQTFIGSTKVRVLHANHGHPALATPAPRVVLSGITTGNGIDLPLLNSTDGWPIESVELDSYIIDITGSPTATLAGRTGGPNVVVSQSLSMDSMFFNANVLNFPECEIDWTFSSTNGGNVSYADPKNVPFVVQPFKPIAPNATIDFTNPMTISSKINENNSTDLVVGPSKVTTNNPGDRKSLRVKAVIRSFNPNLSPILDSDRLNVISIQNRLNYPAGNGDFSINTALDIITIAPTADTPSVASTASKVTFHNDSDGPLRGTFTTNDADLAQHFSKVDVGKLVTITGSTGRNFVDMVVTDMTYTPDVTPKCSISVDYTFPGSTGLETANFTLTQKDRFVDELAPRGGSAAFKYISQSFTLANPSTALHFDFDGFRHDSQDFSIYYRILRTDDKRALEDLNWVKSPFNLLQSGVLVPAYPAPSNATGEMSSYAATVNSLPSFLNFQVKLVGLGGNSARPPRIQQLKGIALDE